MPQVRRYHALLVWLDWVVAILTVAALFFGAAILAHIPNSAPYKITGLSKHMIVGTLILFLVLVRLFLRNVTARPPKAATGNAFLDKVTGVSHGLLYAVLIGQALAGLILANQSGLFSIVFAHQGAVPPDLWVYWPRKVHYLLSRLLMLLIALHIGIALYHTFILKDGLLRRMWLGKSSTS
jgi:cytochrome b561